MATYFVYILKNRTGKIYIGQTNCLARRLEEHNDLSGHRYTSKFGPWVLIYHEQVFSREKAIARESYLKTGAGRDWIKRNVKGD